MFDSLRTHRRSKISNYQQVKKWRHETKKRLVDAFGGDFHHLEPEHKDFTITKSIHSWEKILKEIEKCVCICCRCHREIHANVTDIPSDIRRIDTKSIIYNNPTIAQTDNCPVCSNSKSVYRNTCSNKCASSLRTKTDWSKVNIDNLLSNGENYSSIGRMFGVTGSAVKKQYLKQNGLSNKSSSSL